MMYTRLQWTRFRSLPLQVGREFSTASSPTALESYDVILLVKLSVEILFLRWLTARTIFDRHLFSQVQSLRAFSWGIST